jgi:ZIP family zinc transporter
MHNVSPGAKAFLSAAATGILLFLFWDVLTHAVEPVEGALQAGHDGRFAYLAAILAGGFAVGLLTLVYYDAWMKRRRRKAFLGPGAASSAEFEDEHHFYGGMSPARWLAIYMAMGIGLHNFSEGLAIGQAGARDEVSLAVVLIVGFALHNATEGFGITAPLAGDRDAEGAARQPSWGFLVALGAIGGGPTFVGAVLGHGFTSEPVSVVVLTLAAGSILYVVCQLLGLAAKARRPEILACGLLIGLAAGFLTDAIVTAAGA